MVRAWPQSAVRPLPEIWLGQFTSERHVRALLARKCGREQAPENLRRRIRATIVAIQTETKY